MNIGSQFDNMISGSISSAETFLKSFDIGEVISYEDVEENIDDAGWIEVVRENVEEKPGEGYKRIS